MTSMTPLQACLREADRLIGPSKRNFFDPIRVYVEMAEGQEQRRVFILADSAVRTIAPITLDREHPDQAAILRALPEIVDVETARGAANAAHNAANAADAAYAAAYDAYDAADAAHNAANAADAAYAAAYDAAEHAAYAAYAANYAAYAAEHAAYATHHTARVTRDDRPWLALRDAMLRAAWYPITIQEDARGSALMARIRRDPSDEGARLVYADWLQEQGHPLGDLIVQYPDAGLEEALRVRRENPTEMSTGTAALAGAAVGAVLGGLVYMLMPKNVSKGSA